ncbi:hypothetical protein H7J93_16470 [Mycobacterium barrassiae]|uniref:hypothetical protein n=1 Tax=Mycobacterium barrassiae TaxID=319709 RepID=UPI002265DC7B|nr:hypothetical protein [Mycobacterium barrassiae]MCV7301215.1 hypothetical protein [Mycobacterium barrassiae]
MGGKSPSADDVASFEYDLVDSATAFLTRSVQTMGDDSTGHSAPFAIADLATAVEVLMKARLIRHDWVQVCTNLNKWSFNDLKNGNAKTVAPEEAVDRLANVAGVNMDRHSRDIKSFARLRNRAVHLTLTTQGEQPLGVQAEYGRALDFVLSFLGAEFRGPDIGDDIAAAVDEVIETLTTEVGQIHALVDARMASLADELGRAEVRLVCPRCDQPALLLVHDSTARCAFCLWSPDDGRTAAEEYVDMVLGRSRYESAQDGEPYPVEYCLDCGCEAHVEGLEPISDDRPSLLQQITDDIVLPAYWGCFSCGRTADSTGLDRCTRCGTLTAVSTGGGVPICTDCFAGIVSTG